MAVKLEYALKDAKGKTIVIPKEKIVEELYHQRISFSFEKTTTTYILQFGPQPLSNEFVFGGSSPGDDGERDASTSLLAQ